ncbi:MAG TPA: GNAT family N-acetyltransferase [Burkholderiales bacterium]|nr:GNAT family N-acetyltransferase [Burkholderiales bacterium]
MIAHALRGISRRLGIFVYAVLTRPLKAEKPSPPQGIDIRPVSADESIAACADPALDLAESSVRAALARGDLCVGAFHEGRLIGYSWFAYQATAHVDGIWMDFDTSAIYIYRALVRPEYRGRNIAPNLYRMPDQLFLEKGRRSAIICIDTANRPSLQAAERSGARTAGFAGYFKLGPGFASFRTAGARRMGFRFYRWQPA